MKKREKLPYRKCVGVALLNENNHVWIGQRVPRRWDHTTKFLWQMPQGGIDKGEEAEEAAFRELFEETGISNAEIVYEIDGWLKYDLPDDLLGVALKGRYRGQKQKWYIMRFTGTEEEVNLSMPGHDAEFQKWRWAEADELPKLIIPFKREVYESIVAEIKSLTLRQSSVDNLQNDAPRLGALQVIKSAILKLFNVNKRFSIFI